MTRKCLIVDDVEVSLFVLGGLMEEFGFDVTAVNSGDEVLVALAKETYDLILLDWHLRKASGLALVPVIRATANGDRVPIVVCTGVELDKELHDIANIGVQGLLKKPTSRDGLQHELKKLALL